MLVQFLSAWLVAVAVTQLAIAAPTTLNQTLPGGRVLKTTFKQTSICETTPRVKGYSGYVHIPPSELAPYDQHMYFIFFEARKDPLTAPLTLVMQGGPGAPSTDLAFSMNGPCNVLSDSQTTELNPWSWTNVSNMLWIDQPVQIGYSYDTINQGKVGLINGTIFLDGQPDDQEEVYLPWPGTFSSQNPAHTANTTHNAAVTVYEFMQAWMNAFPAYKRDSIALWTQSYGGHWGPGIATYFLDQNTQIDNNPSCGASKIGIDNVGIINGYIDLMIQAAYYPQFAINNTYNLKVYSDEIAAQAADEYWQPGGCKDTIQQCIDAIETSDPNLTGTGGNAEQEACIAAYESCYGNVYLAYEIYSGRNPFDIGQATWEQFPLPYSVGYLNQNNVLADLGAALNYSQNSNFIPSDYVATGDFVRSATGEIGKLLNAGVPVTLIYGDRDFRCNWYGGEAVSLAIEYPRSNAFRTAGYTDLVVNSSYIGGKTRQAGILSFSRVYDAGHEVTYYQPETVFQLFSRAMQHSDVATGTASISAAGDVYTTTGPATVYNITNRLPSPHPSFCYVMHPSINSNNGSCTGDQLAALRNGSAVLENFVVTSPPWIEPPPLPIYN